MTEAVINGIFPTPIYMSKLDRKLTPLELKFVDKNKKDLVMFPSSLTHMVENKEGTNTRISLAFNVFIKGAIGNNKNLTELIL